MTDDSYAEPEEQGAGFRFRDTTRAPFTTDVRLRFDRLGGAVSAETADISMEGMFVKTAEPRPVGTLVQFEFDLEDGETVQGLGDVVWVRARGSENKPAGMGIQFRYVDPKSREHVFKIVSSFISQISGSEAMPSIPTDGPPEEQPIPTGTVAVPLSSLPGLGAEESQPADGTDSGLFEPPQPGGVDLGLSPPPPPPGGASNAGPFGDLLGGGSESSSDAARQSMSGSFSLSVPRQEAPAAETKDPGLPGLSDAPDVLSSPLDATAASPGLAEASFESSNRSMEPQVDFGDAPAPTSTPESSKSGDLLTGASLDDPILRADETEASEPPALEPKTSGNEIQGSGFFGSPSNEPTPVEPYVPPKEAPDLYGGGAAQSAGRSRASLFIGALLIIAAAAALYVYRPWERLLGGTLNPEPALEAAATPTGPETDGSAPDTSEAPELGSGVGDSSTESAEPGPSGPRLGALDTEPSAEVAEAPQPTLPAPAPPRSWPRDGRLGGIEAISSSGQTLVRITADRPLRAADFETVSLASPPRYLVKIRGLNALYSGGIDGLIFRGLRSGVHRVDGRSELHLVFDMTSAGFEASAELVDGELLVTFR